MFASLNSVEIDSESSNIPTENELYQYPWKYIGYKDFAAYVASDPDFFAFRRFDRLHTRTLLSLQDQLSELEQQLDLMDKRFSRKSTKIVGSCPPIIVDNLKVTDETGDNIPRDINNGTIRDDLEERAALITDIAAKLREYDEAVLRYSKMRRLFPAPERNVQNLKTWFENNEGAIMEAETQFIQHRDELVSMSAQKSALRQWFEDQVVYRTHTKFGMFKKQAQSSSILSTQDQKSTYTVSDEAIDIFGSFAVFVAALTMLVTPLWILQSLDTLQQKLIVITIFIMICLAFLSLATLGRPFESLAATAGYSAVLVVFLQLGSGGNGQ
ncbi:hypothetical protein F5Y19DRAFT_294844 [Xylariaceae sp. FL1651]|nr:hypothetical protein F5Y19DRAFT_294844 [Xylariaceae sp. FL1651]